MSVEKIVGSSHALPVEEKKRKKTQRQKRAGQGRKAGERGERQEREDRKILTQRAAEKAAAPAAQAIWCRLEPARTETQ